MNEMRPNILFVMADDHCCQAMSCYGSKTIRTPNLDALALQGMMFNHMTVTNSLCAPSRAVLLTGKFSHLNGLRSNRDSFDGSQQTFPKLMQGAGYETAIVGKWHLKTQPTGFDYYCLMTGHGRYFDCPMKEPHERWEEGSVREGYLTDVITDHSIDWLENRSKEKPFCLMVHHKAPHGPHDPAERHQDFLADESLPEPPTLLDTYDGRAPEVREDKLQESRMAICRYPQYTEEIAQFPEDRTKATRHMYQTYMKGYLRLVKSLDENVGRLLNYLKKSGLEQNTVVIYTSDNGFFNGEHGFFNKMWMYENALHIPLVARYPGVVHEGSTGDHLVSMLDLAPTFLDLAGAEIPGDMQGESFLPLLRGEETDWRDRVYYHFYEAFNVPEQFGVRTERHKLVHFPLLDQAHRWELYDLEADPLEMNNLILEPGNENSSNALKEQLCSLVEQYEDDVTIVN